MNRSIRLFLRVVGALRPGLAGCVSFGFVLGVRGSESERPFPSRPSSPSSRYAEAVRIFFPPQPPALGAIINRRTHPTAPPPPEELAGFVNEIFYPSLGTRLYHDKLSREQRSRLEAYRASKRALQDQLEAKLDDLRQADPATRIQQLETLSRDQTPRIVALEAAAEALWRDLTRNSDAWGALREWRVADRVTPPFTGQEVAAVMRAAAYYQSGLSLAQRGLLREISIELEAVADSPEHAMFAQPYLFFSPAPARVTLPADMAADVVEKIAVFQSKKSELKKELYDMVYANDNRRWKVARGNPFEKLAQDQAKRFAVLESLAEEIRRGLAEQADATMIIERSPLPKPLQARVNRMIEDYTAAQQKASDKMDPIVVAYKRNPFVRVGYRFEGERLKVTIFPIRQLGVSTRGIRQVATPPDAAEEVATVRAEVQKVEDEYGYRLAELINDRMAIRDGIRSALRLIQSLDVDRALATALRVARAEGSEAEYREYRIAVFQPGLSPEQRRLYFDRVVERLGLVAPLGEAQPRRRRDPR